MVVCRGPRWQEGLAEVFWWRPLDAFLEFGLPVIYSVPLNSQCCCRKSGEADLVEGVPLVPNMLVLWSCAPENDG